MDVWTVLDFTWHEGGNVIGVADSPEGAKRIAERDYHADPDYVRDPLEWKAHTEARADMWHEADQGDSPQSYIVKRWTVESSPVG